MRWIKFIICGVLSTGLFAQPDPDPQTLKGFMQQGKTAHQAYIKNNPQEQFYYTAAKVRVISLNERDSDTTDLICHDLVKGVPFDTLSKRYKLREMDDYVSGPFLFPPVFLDQYFNKILFHAFPLPSRYRNLCFSNDQGFRTISDFRTGTRLLDTLDDLICIEFMEPFTQRPLPSFMNQGLNYYKALSGNLEPLYFQRDRIRKGIPHAFDSAYYFFYHYEWGPDEPEVPDDTSSQLARDTYHRDMDNYRKELQKFEKQKCDSLISTMSKYTNMDSLRSFVNYCRSNEVGCELEEQALCFGINIPDKRKFYAPTHYKYWRGRHRIVLNETVSNKDYGSFAKAFIFCEFDEEDDKLQKALFKSQQSFYKYPARAYIGSLAAAFVSPHSDLNYYVQCVEHIDRNRLAKKAMIKNISAWFKSNQRDELMAFVLGYIWWEYLEEERYERNSKDLKQEWTEAMKAYPNLTRLITDY